MTEKQPITYFTALAKNFPLIFGGIVAYILLLIYATTVTRMTWDVCKYHWKRSNQQDRTISAGIRTDPESKTETAKAKADSITTSADSAVARTSAPPIIPSDGVRHVVTLIGGLISALVVSKLSLTKPGSKPEMLTPKARENLTESAEELSAFLAVFYLVAWLLCGLMALVFGVLIYPNTNSTLSDIGTTWLGLAVTAGYSYFGIDPSGDH